MKTAVVIFLCGLSSVSFVLSADSDLDQRWAAFKKQFNITYDSPDEEITRRELWEVRVAFIDKHNAEFNAGMQTYSLGLNKYSDATREEVKRMLCATNVHMSDLSNTTSTGQNTSAPSYSTGRSKNQFRQAAPASIDWRQQGVVGPIRDQDPCSTCWAFQSAAAMESAWAIKTGNLVQLSPENFVDCAKPNQDQCTAGFFIDDAFAWELNSNGVALESEYPYATAAGRIGTCQTLDGQFHVKATGITDIKSESDLHDWVGTQGPAIVVVAAAGEAFLGYTGGIFNDPSCSDLALSPDAAHAVLVIGYDTASDGTQYWIIKNSWSTTWGEQGFMRVTRNTAKCGFGTDAYGITV